MKIKIIFFSILFLLFFNNVSFATEISKSPEVLSKHVVVLERTTGTVLYEKDGYSKCAMASTTKILTAIIAIENCSLEEKVIISKFAANVSGSVLGIKENMEMTIESLLYGLLLRSGNDCAIALAEYIGKDLESFSKIMNEKAFEIGLFNSYFVSPHGLDDENHYSTAYDMALLTKYALQNEIFCKIVNTKNTSIMVGKNLTSINNTNELLGNVEGIYGVKTGFTGKAGRCLITAVKRENLDIIIVILGADTKDIRGRDTKELIKYIFENYEMVDTYEKVCQAFDKNWILENIKISKGKNKLDIYLEENKTYLYPIRKDEKNNLKISLFHISLVEAPIYINTKIGEMRVRAGNNILYKLDIKVCDNIPKKTWKNFFLQVINEISLNF